MKFSKNSGSSTTGVRRWGRLSQLSLVCLIGLVVATLLSACQLVTIDYVYLAGSGTIQAFAVDSESGALRNAGKPTSSEGTTPVALAVTPDYANLYVANSDNNSVVHFTVAADSTLTKQDSVTLADSPVAMAVNAAGTYLYVVSGSATATLSEFPLSSGKIGPATSQQSLVIPGFGGDTVVPTGVVALPNNNAVFVTMYDKSAYNPGGTVTSSAHPGWVFSYGVGSGGALTPGNGSPFQAGVKPSGLAVDPTSRFVYVSDYASNHLIGYGITDNSTLNFLISGPYKTGAEPTAVAVDPRGKYIYVSNALDSSVSAYAIALATGVPSAVVNVTGSQVNSSDTEPVALAVDPALGRYVYTANFLGNSISGFRLNPNTGSLDAAQATPYPSEAKPRAIVIIPHGNHSLQATAP